MDGIMDAVEMQSKVIKLQADIIDELFIVLLQHISAEEAEKLAVTDKIKEAANLHAELEF